MSNLTKMEITVMKNTADALKTISQRSELEIGEVVDRMTAQCSTTDPDVALKLVIDNVLIITSKLALENCQQVIEHLVSHLLIFLPQDRVDVMAENIKSNREAVMQAYFIFRLSREIC